MPLIVILEDLHWADSATMDLTRHLVSLLDDARVLFIATTRPELEGRGGLEPPPGSVGANDRVRWIEIPLSSLNEANSRQLTENALGKKVGDKLLRFLHERALGNPLFIEEILRYLLDEEMIREADRAFDLVAGAPHARIPESIHGLILSRIDKLADIEKKVIKSASVIGRTFWERLLIDLVEKGVKEELKTLQSKELIFPYGTSDIIESAEFIFKHALIRDVTYDGILKKTRRRLHRFIGGWLDENVKEKTADILAATGHHYERAGEREKGRESYSQAGEKSKVSQSASQAVEYFGKAYELGGKLEDLERKGDALIYSGRTKESKQVYEEVEESLNLLERDISSLPLRIRIKRKLAGIQETLGDMEKAEKHYEEALGMKFALENVEEGLEGERPPGTVCREFIKEHAQTLLALAVLRGEVQGRFEEARRLTREAAEFIRKTSIGGVELPEEDRGEIGASVEDNFGTFDLRQGFLDRSFEYLTRSSEYWEKRGLRREMARHAIQIGNVYWQKGELDQALEYYGKCLETSREIGDKRMEGTVSGNMGGISNQKGEADKGLEFYHKAKEIFETIGDKRQVGIAMNNLGTVYLGKGDLDRASEYIPQSLAISEEIGDQINLVWGLYNMGQICSQKGELERALENFRKSLKISEEVGLKRQEVVTSIRIGSVLGEKGMFEKARMNLEKARAMAGEVGDKFLLIEIELSLGCICQDQKLFEEGGEHFRRGLHITRQLVARKLELEALFKIATLERQKGNCKEAYEGHRKVLTEGEKSKQPLSVIGEMHLELAQDVVAMYRTETGILPEDPSREARRHLAKSDKLLKDTHSFHTKTKLAYTRAMVEMFFGNRAEGEQKIEAVINETKRKGYITMAREMEDFSTKNKGDGGEN
jgi:tetratricopeptide (TPR) repeat protein